MLRTLNTATYIKRHLDEWSNRIEANAIALEAVTRRPYPHCGDHLAISRQLRVIFFGRPETTE